MEMKRYYIAQIKRPDKEMRNHSGESMRGFYVARLSGLDAAVLDAGTQCFFADLIEKDGDEWVRLEAAADVAFLPLTEDMIPRVTGLLEKCRRDERVNFQVLAAQSLQIMGLKRHKPDMEAEETLARIARGRDMAGWKVMIPPHNVGTMATDPSSGAEIPFEDFYKLNLRTKAIAALWLSKDGFSKQVLTGLAKDGNAWVREYAKTTLAH